MPMLKHVPAASVFVGLAMLAACRQPEASEEAVEDRQPAAAQVNPRGATPASFPQIFERVSPAVVSVNAARVGPRTPLTDFFSGRASGQPLVQAMSAGSGFFISADGHILTNNHVVGDANQLSVVLRDGRELPATVVGRDPGSDLAVLRVEGRDFPHVTFSSAANPRVGEGVIAIGNPFGLGTTATHGIVSAFGRDIGSPYVDFIQLDAPINQGNSGGPTFNEQGEVVGVNTAIFSPSGGSVGIGFAIPATTARDVAQQLIRTGRVERGFIGASLLDLPAQSPLGSGGGVVVAALVGGAPAARAGLMPGDIIVGVQGQEVEDAADVIRRVVTAKSGAALRFDVVRQGSRRSVVVPVERRPT